MARPSRRTRHRPSASWTRVMLTQEDRMRRRLQQRHWLRLHAALTGGLSLAGMSLLSLGLLHAGMHSMALRYGVALACGYLLYLLLLRLWAECMLRRDWEVSDVPDVTPGSNGSSPARTPEAGGFDSGQGGSYGAVAPAAAGMTAARCPRPLPRPRKALMCRASMGWTKAPSSWSPCCWCLRRCW